MKSRLFLLILIPVFGFNQEVSQLRVNYPKAANNADVTNRMYNELSSISHKSESLLAAYKGAVATLKAKHAKGISRKKELFKQGVELIEHAVTTKPNNIEIRCLRLGVQENSPKIVGYKNAMNSDKQFLLDHFELVSDPEIKKFISGYVKISKLFTPSEKQLF